jgi:CMP-N-acetylneuraminic acid synthetase
MDSKNIDDICIIVQARMGSQRVPKKMLRPFADTTLTDILFDKLSRSTIVPKSNIYFSAYEDELKEVGKKYGINIFDRSKESAFAETDMKLIYEWHNKLPYKYVVLISACNPLLTIETIDEFIQSFIQSDKEGAFAVFEKKTYYWDKQGKPLTDWQGVSIMNTKNVEPIYEAAHCLYASRLDIIDQGYWMDKNYPPQPELYVMKELEAFDIDYEWQFKLGEQLHRMDIC